MEEILETKSQDGAGASVPAHAPAVKIAGRKSGGGSAGAGSGSGSGAPASGPTPSGAASLAELCISTLNFAELSTLPVVVIHAPQGAGTSSLIGSLLVEAQRDLGVDGAVVLCDRPTPGYMRSIGLPTDVVSNKAADKVLAALIAFQDARMGMTTRVSQLRLALALDDVLFTSKLLKSEEFQQNIKRAKDYNIMVIVATPDTDALPRNLRTFATHVFATASTSVGDTKNLHKVMFDMYENAGSFAETLCLCRKHEYLVGLHRPTVERPKLLDLIRRYSPLQHTHEESASSDTDSVFSIHSEIVSQLAQIVKK